MKEIKFVSYDGAYPNLCRGTLVLEIDGKTVRFGNNEDCDYPDFWYSGGRICRGKNWNMWAERGPWKAGFSSDTPFTEEEQKQLLKVFQDNVHEGCCGGCI